MEEMDKKHIGGICGMKMPIKYVAGDVCGPRFCIKELST